jgi:hypothetical protein
VFWGVQARVFSFIEFADQCLSPRQQFFILNKEGEAIMKYIFLTMALVLTLSAISFAQSSDYNKTEFYIGYSNGQVDTGSNFSNSGNAVQNFFNSRTNFNGFEAAGVYNFSRYLGVKADVSGTYHSEGNFSFPVTTGATTQTVSGNVRDSLYNVLGGIQIKDNASTKRFKPFAEALVGLGHARSDVTNLTCTTTSNIDCTNFGAGAHTNGFAGAFGGGLDVKLNDKLDIRAIQVDYNPVRLNGVTTNNLRFGVGIVIK